MSFQAVLVTDGNVSFAIFVYDDLTRLVIEEASYFPSIIGVDSGNGALGSSATYFYIDFETENEDELIPFVNDVSQRNNSIFYRIDGSSLKNVNHYYYYTD